MTRLRLLEGHDDTGGPFAVVVREGEPQPCWPGLRLSELGAFQDVGELLREAHRRGLLLGAGAPTEH